ncbi:MAG: response regulator [Campylobacterales bacterium]|nr:response regulator [Campylobacterales bacterium]
MTATQNILIVDDEKSNIDILLNLFSSMNKSSYNLIVALSGEKALQIIEKREIDLILLDIMMPGIDGYEVCRRLKANKQTQDIPILFITSSTDEESIIKAYELGAVDYVTKPFRAVELMARVKINLELQSSMKELELLYSNLQDSITYAAQIQNAIIPQSELLDKYFDEHFVIWEPKDTVGGDIYLFEELRHDDECLLMVIDCTGHGVPGAFVTMLVKAIEREIIGKINQSNDEVSPARILQHFNKVMKNLLKQESVNTLSDSGFDGGVLYINKKEKVVRFAGAQTPFIYVKDGQMKIIKGDRHSIGYRKSQDDYSFSDHSITYSNNICGYLTTDGYLDQTGGERGFMLGKKHLLRLIDEHHEKNFAMQKELFVDKLKSYQGAYNRKDDITLVGFKVV